MGAARHPEDLVTGELYKLLQPSKTLKALDDYEQNYRRELRRARLETGEVLTAWVYIYRRRRPEDCYLPSGEWN
jgi:gamma-glutamylcyclotransferase (GGCT)/AIG2-like uncharacterized protein YtfP